MKIAFTPVIAQIKHKNLKVNNSQSLRFAQNVNMTDTVSFGAVKSQRELLLDELEQAFNEKIKPTMQTNQKYNKAVGIIGYHAQCSEETIKKTGTEFYSKYLDSLDEGANTNLDSMRQYIGRIDKYSRNCNEFNMINKKTLRDEFNVSGVLYDEIQKTAEVFDNSTEVLKLIPLKNCVKDVRNSIRNEVSTIPTDNIDELKKPVFVKGSAVWYMASNPYQDSVKLIEDIHKTRENLCLPKSVWYEDDKTIEHLFNKKNEILESIEHFDKLKPEIDKFIEEHKNPETEFLSKDEIVNIYKNLEEKNQKIINENFAKVGRFFEENYTKKGISIDLDKVDEDLQKQSNAISNLNEIVNKLKEQYIKEHNCDFWANSGY